MSAKIKLLQKKQQEIEYFFETAKDKSVSGQDLRKWIVDSVTHFYDIGMKAEMVSLFLESCRFTKDEDGKVAHGIFKFKILKRGYVLSYEGVTGEFNPHIVPVQIALSISRLLVEKYQDQERVIPLSFLKLFEEERYLPLRAAFDALEFNYQQEDAKGMASSIVTVIDLLTGNIDELKEDGTLKKRLEKLYTEKKLCEKYHINREIVWALNTARIVRNYEVEHPSLESTGEISMREAVGTAHLLILFANSLFAVNKINFKLDENVLV